MGKITRRNHYIPQTYLKHFLEENFLFMYKKGPQFFALKDESRKRLLKIKGEEGLKNIGLENNLYYTGIDEINSNDIEQLFVELGEGAYVELIKELEQIEIGQKITAKQKEQICIFMASMRIRTPLFKNETEEMDSKLRKHFMSMQMEHKSSEVMLKEFNRDGFFPTLEEVEEMRQTYIKQEYEITYSNSYYLSRGFSVLQDIYQLLINMDIIIFQANDLCYCTTDNPFTFFVPSEFTDFYNNCRSLASIHTEIYFPLTKKMAVFMSRKNKDRDMTKIYCKSEIIKSINYNVSMQSLNFIFSPREMVELRKFLSEPIPFPFYSKVN